MADEILGGNLLRDVVLALLKLTGVVVNDLITNKLQQMAEKGIKLIPEGFIKTLLTYDENAEFLEVDTVNRSLIRFEDKAKPHVFNPA